MRLFLFTFLFALQCCSSDISTGEVDVLTPAGPENFEDGPTLSSEELVLNDRALALVNAQRKSGCRCGNRNMPPVPALRVNSQLFAAAEVHANDMRRMNNMRHQGSDGSDVGDRVTRQGYRWQAVGENIARGYSSVEQVVQGWFDSPGHCQNMMSENFNEMALAHDDLFWAQVLAAAR
ncbi:MAG: CAP domain-containing protein [Bacteroidota bacterium]